MKLLANEYLDLRGSQENHTLSDARLIDAEMLGHITFDASLHLVVIVPPATTVIAAAREQQAKILTSVAHAS